MNNSKEVQKVQRQNPSLWKRVLLITVSLVIALLAGGIFLTRYQGERRLKELSELAESQSMVIQRQDLQLFSLPLAWSVRKELMRSNYDQIDEYFTEMIKRKGFGLIMLIDPSGIIKVSTDRKLQGSFFSMRYPQMKLGGLVPVSYAVPEGKSMFLVPVMGLNEKIGTIAFVYSYRELLLP
jgi:uncharacterized protein YneF (UPF0154 family)